MLLTSIEEALPEAVARAEHGRVPFTLLVARPGPAVAAGSRAPAPSAGDVEDLTAALSVSLSPTQSLYDAGRGHLAVVVPGRSRAAQREAVRLTRRAAAGGAPLFTWAAARYPRDASTAGGLLEVARNRLDGRLVSRIDAAAGHSPEPGTGRSGAAIWAGVAAAVLLGAVAFALHGSGPGSPQTATGTMSSGLPGGSSSTGSGAAGSANAGANGASGPAAGGSSTGASSTGSSAPSGPSAPSAGSGPSASTGSSANSGTGATGTPGTPQAGTDSTQGIVSTATTLPSTGSLLGGTSATGTGTSGASGSGTTGTSGSTTTTSTTTTTTPSSTSSQCTGLVTSLTCTANTLLGGLGL